MRYEGKLYRPPSEAYSYILQATIGCSHNLCTYCDMYRDKRFRIRSLSESLEDIALATRRHPEMEKVFVADGDALAMPLSHWLPILERLAAGFPRLRQVSCYATAQNLIEKSAQELEELRAAGLRLLYIGPESGDDLTLRRIVKGASFAEHEEAATKARAAKIDTSVIMLLGAGGVARSLEHAQASAKLITAMDPRYLAALTLTIVPGTPLAKWHAKGGFVLPEPMQMLAELRTMIAESKPSRALFRTNHASNYLPTGGELPRDRERLLDLIDAAMQGQIALKPEHRRGL